MGEFGDKFRKAREKKDISLDAVSNVTKISSRMLQAIEQERFDVLHFHRSRGNPAARLIRYDPTNGSCTLRPGSDRFSASRTAI